eukprot:TRINITY_DN4572_c0_g1_i3.p1 TRINITY_DN4572_c0_g1~~TRINITY_DN4572_c0_g1_i3.p1  ORF type:complete len:128 (-),score=6.35 TRINITY_DN4572_c0_g1_i3:103-486(-)
MVLWILLSIILLPLVVMLIRLSYSMVKYFYYSQDYKNFWKYPTFGTLLTDGVNINTGALHMYSIVPRQPNGSFIKFANLGFYIGAKPGIMVSDRETIKMVRDNIILLNKHIHNNPDHQSRIRIRITQ